MPWLLDQLNQGSTAIDKTSRLYAFGHDVYNLIPIMNDLKLSSGTSYSGLTGRLSVNSRGEIMRQPGWATFKSGTPTSTGDYSAVRFSNPTNSNVSTPTQTRSTNTNQVINRSNRYDPKTWNTGTNRRKQEP